MAITHGTYPLQWSGADSVSLTTGARSATSDPVGVDATVVSREIIVKVDSAAGTPAAGDTTDVYLVATTGDPDAEPETADEYSTVGHALFLCTIDSEIEDPAVSAPVPLPIALKDYKIYAYNNG